MSSRFGEMQAQTAQQGANSYNHGFAPAPNVDSPMTILEAAERQAHSHTQSLTEFAARLQALLERAFGATPKADGTSSTGSIPVGAAHRLSAALTPHDGLVARMHSLLNDLERLV